MLAIDTNILFYAINEEAPDHQAARTFLSKLDYDDQVVISEFSLAELYTLLRNPAINRTPLETPEAVDVVQIFRRHPRWRTVWFPVEDRDAHDRTWKLAATPGTAFRRIYDLRFAVSLLAQGVSELATANVRDFRGLGFARVWNPLQPE